MDRLRWDSEVYEEYIASLQRMERRLTDQIQQLNNARRSIMRQGVTAEDKTLSRILYRLEASLKRLNGLSDRIHRLMDALELSMDMFRSAEKKIGNMGTDMMYLRVKFGGARVIPITLTNPFLNRYVTPDWLSMLAGTPVTAHPGS